MESRLIARAPFSFAYEWQAHDQLGPFAPRRMFQWQAINDMPGLHCVDIEPDGYRFKHGYWVDRAPV